MYFDAQEITPHVTGEHRHNASDEKVGTSASSFLHLFFLQNKSSPLDINTYFTFTLCSLL